MPDQWHYSTDGHKAGPVSDAQLKTLASEGKITPESLLWKQGMKDWVPARSAKGLFPEPPPLPKGEAEPPPLPKAAAGPPPLPKSSAKDATKEGTGRKRSGARGRRSGRPKWIPYAVGGGVLLAVAVTWAIFGGKSDTANYATQSPTNTQRRSATAPRTPANAVAANQFAGYWASDREGRTYGYDQRFLKLDADTSFAFFQMEYSSRGQRAKMKFGGVWGVDGNTIVTRSPTNGINPLRVLSSGSSWMKCLDTNTGVTIMWRRTTSDKFRRGTAVLSGAL